jgi:hypothetical protein
MTTSTAATAARNHAHHMLEEGAFACGRGGWTAAVTTGGLGSRDRKIGGAELGPPRELVGTVGAGDRPPCASRTASETFERVPCLGAGDV